MVVVLPPPVGGSKSAGMSSGEMICTGSYAATMETRERSAIATGLAKEELMQKRARIMALESRGLWNRDISN